MERGYLVHGPVHMVHKHLCGSDAIALKKNTCPQLFFVLSFDLYVTYHTTSATFCSTFFCFLQKKKSSAILVFRMYLSQLPLTGCTFTSQKIQNGRLEMREKRMKNFPVPQAMSRLADYFIVIGYDHDKDSKYFL